MHDLCSYTQSESLNYTQKYITARYIQHGSLTIKWVLFSLCSYNMKYNWD